MCLRVSLQRLFPPLPHLFLRFASAAAAASVKQTKKAVRGADECAVVFLLVLVARTQLRPVDVGELERLRYRYKGA